MLTGENSSGLLEPDSEECIIDVDKNYFNTNSAQGNKPIKVTISGDLNTHADTTNTRTVTIGSDGTILEDKNDNNYSR